MEDVQEQAVPILRVADAGAAAAWYARLGFAEEWVHRFEPGFPAFVSVARGEVRLFLSEHTGDARPDTLVHLWVRDVDAVAAEFGAPVEEMPWGRQVDLRDPDGNRLRAAAAPGADRPGGGGRDAGLRLPFPLVYTGDVDRLAGFYTGLLGFTEAFRFPADPSLPAEFVQLALGPCALGLGSAASPAAHGRPTAEPGGPPEFELCLEAGDVDAETARLRAAGVPVLREPEDMPWNERMAYVADPDGRPIMLYTRH
ncbi:glyoxalase superfamily protein [Nocardiopsis composta]|uniref:Bleomycin resistance protein n=1 Tax=Nocardiopsis composta TaxID=157465 RepID=A0A7W8QMA6_9ACTN|nr:glyoxalase superfamily protein [Nocardiopsis composta]MBB5432889.1 catechol 2,3-dioxygenase-like lactoylglutathione lyase family enzyme [Nocardiopsis composta]